MRHNSYPSGCLDQRLPCVPCRHPCPGEEAGVAGLIQGRDVEGDTYLLRTLLLVGLDRSLFFLILFCPVQSEMLQEANTSNFKSKLQSLQITIVVAAVPEGLPMAVTLISDYRSRIGQYKCRNCEKYGERNMGKGTWRCAVMQEEKN
ncbi:uncharacterized protein [Lolium perenne]|uniref:uncharacterized protein isoform X2 n=1 Tax=Lolium perenne TaxID=4522 RepID=UPI0021F541E4|nr:uncharacterized protein LOC127321415 isoform X2 [Lolium perenne]